jgi:hypothetical protein
MTKNIDWREAAVAQRYSGENEKINEIERTRVCSPPRATSLKKKKKYIEWATFWAIFSTNISGHPVLQLSHAK